MNANVDDTLDPKSDAPPEPPDAAEADSSPQGLPRADPPFGAIESSTTEIESAKEPSEAPRLLLMPWPKGPEAADAVAAPNPARNLRVDPLKIAASVAVVGFVAVSLFAGYDHLHGRALVAASAQEAHQETQKAEDLSSSLAALKSRIETIEATRSQEQTADLKKTLSEIKSAAATAQGANAAMAALALRVDKMDKEQNARLDKLTEKVDQASANRNAEIVARLERLEKRPVTIALAQPAPQPSPAPKASPAPPPPAIANDVTGSIDRPKPVLRAYTLDDVRGGVAYVESRDGPYTVSPGDVLPGAGRVLRIERHGPNWIVVTSQGVITTPEQPY